MAQDVVGSAINVIIETMRTLYVGAYTRNICCLFQLHNCCFRFANSISYCLQPASDRFQTYLLKQSRETEHLIVKTR